MTLGSNLGGVRESGFFDTMCLVARGVTASWDLGRCRRYWPRANELNEFRLSMYLSGNRKTTTLLWARADYLKLKAKARGGQSCHVDQQHRCELSRLKKRVLNQ
jgi:hypothetical protein